MLKAYVLLAIGIAFIAVWIGFFGFIARVTKIVISVFKREPPPKKPKTFKKYRN